MKKDEYSEHKQRELLLRLSDLFFVAYDTAAINDFSKLGYSELIDLRSKLISLHAKVSDKLERLNNND